jgi:dolichyl-phosphate beta-glucosyltransferase
VYARAVARESVSIVVPVYNEEARLPRFLDAASRGARKACDEAGLELVQVVVADDGSTDRTAAILRERAAADALLTAVTLPENHGKGAVVAAGVRAARGELVLITDVDLSTPLSELARLHRAIASGADLVMGSRSLDRGIVERSRYRDVMSRTYNLLVRLLTSLPYRDTQCGFKLVRTDAARFLLREQLIERYAFDVEALLRGRAAGLTMVEVPVRWRQDRQSRVTPLRTAAKMALDTAWIAYRLRELEQQAAPVEARPERDVEAQPVRAGD